MVYRLRRGLADLLAPERQEPLSLVTPIGSAAPPASPVFEDQLKAMLQQSGHRALLSGRVNFIGLQKVKERYGSGWERIADRAERMARTIIERHLVSGDIYTGINGLTFVIVFATLTPERAKVKCLAIADAITKALLGEQGGDLLEIKTAVTRVDGTLGLESISFTDQLCASLEGAEELQFTEAPARAPRPALPAAPPPAGKAPPPALPAPPPAGKAPRPPRLDPLANLRFLYRPIWDRPRNVVSGYLCAAQVLSTDGSTVLGDAEALIEGDVDDRARLDERIRERALRDLAALFHEGRKLLVTLPVHFETLSAVGRRRDYLAAIDRELVDGAAKYLMIEIAGVPAGVPPARLVEAHGCAARPMPRRPAEPAGRHPRSHQRQGQRRHGGRLRRLGRCRLRGRADAADEPLLPRRRQGGIPELRAWREVSEPRGHRARRRLQLYRRQRGGQPDRPPARDRRFPPR